MLFPADINNLSDLLSSESSEAEHKTTVIIDGLCSVRLRDTEPRQSDQVFCAGLCLQPNLLSKLRMAPGFAVRCRLYFSLANLSVLLRCPAPSMAIITYMVSSASLYLQHFYCCTHCFLANSCITLMPLILSYLHSTGFNVQSCLCKFALTHAFTTDLLVVDLCEAFFLCRQERRLVVPSRRVHSHTLCS